ncbi:MAG: beta-ketoacyl synthase chain length factor [Bacteroidetes bacterium]|nr:beta-ketoacyl synthase chain length factor [Bacteroidota bacterium]
MYINAAIAISPQDTFLKDQIADEVIEHNGIMKTILPDFKEYFKPIDLRRMSRIIKSGTTTALECLKEAGIEKPDAIITGTGLGCLEDTESFLNKMIDNNEGLLTPTAFIQSTHNTIGGHVALTVQCNEYNVAYVHKTISFETALLDAVLMLGEGKAENILVGGIDEMTQENYELKKRVNLWKKEPFSNLNTYKSDSEGCIPGEGATFFNVTKTRKANSYAEIKMVELVHKYENIDDFKKLIENRINNSGITINDIDLVLFGYNGDDNGDAYYDLLKDSIFSKSGHAYYKHLCGEYDTAPAFALWLAVKIFKTGKAPDNIFIKKPEGEIKNILIYNQDINKNHAFMLLSK